VISKPLARGSIFKRADGIVFVSTQLPFPEPGFARSGGGGYVEPFLKKITEAIYR
jgi:hypothetical protein